MISSPERLSLVTKKRSKLKDVSHLLLMSVPNLLNPNKLLANIRHPFREVLHTSHKQYPVEMKEGVEYHIVEHRRFNKLETVDIVTPDTFPKGLIPRAKQLFDRSFYYGHDKYFPQPFRLVDRTFVSDGFNQEEHLHKVIKSKR